MLLLEIQDLLQSVVERLRGGRNDEDEHCRIPIDISIGL